MHWTNLWLGWFTAVSSRVETCFWGKGLEKKTRPVREEFYHTKGLQKVGSPVFLSYLRETANPELPKCIAINDMANSRLLFQATRSRAPPFILPQIRSGCFYLKKNTCQPWISNQPLDHPSMMMMMMMTNKKGSFDIWHPWKKTGQLFIHPYKVHVFFHPAARSSSEQIPPPSLAPLASPGVFHELPGGVPHVDWNRESCHTYFLQKRQTFQQNNNQLGSRSFTHHLHCC